MKKIVAVLVLAIAALGGALFSGVITIASLVGTIDIEPERELRTAGVGTEVTIYRDNMGVPHIYGDDSEDIMFAVGYAIAEDRLFQLEVIVRAAGGSLAEVLGPELLAVDKEARKIAYTQAQLDEIFTEGMSPYHQKHLQAMVNGINQYVAEMRANPDEKLPLEFASLDIEPRDYTPQDILNGFSVSVRLFGAKGGRELINLSFLNDLKKRHGDEIAETIFNDVLVLNDPDAYAFTEPDTEVTIDPPQLLSPTQVALNPVQTRGSAKVAEIAERMTAQQEVHLAALEKAGFSRGASRSMVVGPNKSANGNVLMMQATADGHEVHVSGGGFEVTGMTFAAMGLPVMGRTEHFGWLITTANRDTIDIFAEQLNPDNKHQYWYNGGWRDMEVRSETINVAGGEPVVIEVASTVHGPVVAWDLDAGQAYSKKWAVWMKEGIGWSAYFDIARAKNFNEFEALMQKYIMNGNYSYGDVNGHIQSWHFNTLPIRAEGIDPRLPTPGTGEYEWQRLQRFDEFATIANPERDFNFIWNNKPRTNVTYGDSARWGKHFRTYLPLSLLRNDDSVTLDDMKAFNKTIGAAWGSANLNITSPQFFIEFWDEAVAGSDDAELQQAVKLMKEWDEFYLDRDGDGHYDHAGLTLFRAWLPLAKEKVLADDIGEWWHKFDGDTYIKYGASLLIRILEGQQAGLPTQYDFLNGKSRAEVVRETLQATVAQLKQDYRGDMAEWKSPIMWRYLSEEAAATDSDKLPMPDHVGAATMIGAAARLGHVEKAVVHNGMPNWTTIMEFGDSEPRMLSLTPSGGQSWFINQGFQASPHINDQYKRHRDLDYKTIEMAKQNVLKDVESTLVIKPVN